MKRMNLFWGWASFSFMASWEVYIFCIIFGFRTTWMVGSSQTGDRHEFPHVWNPILVSPRLGSLLNGTFRFYTSMSWRGYAQWVRAIRSYSSLCLLVDTCLKTSSILVPLWEIWFRYFRKTWICPIYFSQYYLGLGIGDVHLGPYWFPTKMFHFLGIKYRPLHGPNETLPGPIVMNCAQWHWWSWTHMPDTFRSRVSMHNHPRVKTKWLSRKYLLQIKFVCRFRLLGGIVFDHFLLYLILSMHYCFWIHVTMSSLMDKSQLGGFQNMGF